MNVDTSREAVERFCSAVNESQNAKSLLRALLAERDALRAEAQKWAVYAFNHHGDDATLYNGLATLGGVNEDGIGWSAEAARLLRKLL